MKVFRYQSGEEIKVEDEISYHGESGKVQFVITGKTGKADMDWYLEQNPDGGVMLNVNNLGLVFLNDIEDEEDLILLSRANGVKPSPN